jgi:hypothetical protein
MTRLIGEPDRIFRSLAVWLGLWREKKKNETALQAVWLLWSGSCRASTLYLEFD